MRVLRWLSMSCEDFELRCGGDPLHTTARQRLHARMCRACRRYADDILTLEVRIRRALQVGVPEDGDAPVSGRRDRDDR